MHTVQRERVLSVMVALAALGSGESPGLGSGDNVLIIVADDLGVDALSSYGECSEYAPTPTIDGLRDSGVLFRNAWSNPVCSPTRATIQTGRYGFRNGVLTGVKKTDDEGLPYSETIIPEVLDLNPPLGYAHAAIGKWHLTTESQGGFDGPNLSGYGHFSGAVFGLPSYFEWTKSTDGDTFLCLIYATSDNVNEAIQWINDQGDTPWFMWLAFNAPHQPYHAPPDDLHSYDLSGDRPERMLFRAMIEAMDTEMGRLFASIDEMVLQKTNIIFLGDNGTAGDVTEPPFDSQRAKGTLYEGGINVPLIISGPQVAWPGGESDVLVNTTDLFATALEMMGVDVESSLPPGLVLDSRSLLPLLGDQPFEPRSVAYAEYDNGDTGAVSSGQAIRNVEGFKLIRLSELGTQEFYDLALDPFETTDLLLGTLDPIQQANFDELSLILQELTSGACAGDANSDGVVDPLDGGFVLSRFGCPVGTGYPTCDAADQNHDGQVNPLDSGYVLARFGECE